MRHRGTRRTRRLFTELEARALLRSLGEARRTCRQAMASAPIKSGAYEAASGIMDAIDKAAEVLTSEPGAFLPRPHGGGEDGTPNPEPGKVSPALQAAIHDVLRAELYVSYVGGEEQEGHLQDLAAKVTEAALAVPLHRDSPCRDQRDRMKFRIAATALLSTPKKP